MAEDKKGFILYADMRGTFDKLPNDKAGELIKHIFSYINDENPEPKDLIIEIAFEPIMNQLKRDLKKWESIREKRSLAGKASANKRQQNATKATHVESVEQTPTNSTVNVNDTVKVNVNDTVINKKPSLKDFKNFAIENCKDINIQAVELKYKAWVANDWKDGKDKKIKNWKSKLLNTLTYLPKDETNKQDQKRTAKEPSKNIKTTWD